MSKKAKDKWNYSVSQEEENMKYMNELLSTIGTVDDSIKSEEIFPNVEEWIPIYTTEQLKKVGTGACVIIDGVSYNFDRNKSYKLMNDINITGVNWIPLEKFAGIFCGQNYKINNLKININNSKDVRII